MATGAGHPHDSFGLFPFGMTFDPHGSGFPPELARLFEAPMDTNNGFMYRVPPVVPRARVDDADEDAEMEDKRDEGSQELE